jgi:hypothetical protein
MCNQHNPAAKLCLDTQPKHLKERVPAQPHLVQSHARRAHAMHGQPELAEPQLTSLRNCRPGWPMGALPSITMHDGVTHAIGAGQPHQPAQHAAHAATWLLLLTLLTLLTTWSWSGCATMYLCAACRQPRRCSMAPNTHATMCAQYMPVASPHTSYHLISAQGRAMPSAGSPATCQVLAALPVMPSSHLCSRNTERARDKERARERKSAMLQLTMPWGAWGPWCVG